MHSFLLRVLKPKSFVNFIRNERRRLENTKSRIPTVTLFSRTNDFVNYSLYKRCNSTLINTNIAKLGSFGEVNLNKGKIFIELENEVYHKFLENSSDYEWTTHRSDTKLNAYDVTEEEFSNIVSIDCWKEQSENDYFESFVKAAQYCTTTSLQAISDPIFKTLCATFPTKCHRFSDGQLVKCFVCLQNWPNAPNVNEENFRKVWTALDAECLSRKAKWDYKTTLFMIDLWYSLKLTRISAFVGASVMRLIDKVQRLSKQDLVQLLFYLNTRRTVPKIDAVYEVECHLSRYINFLNIDELAIVCAGYFKTQTNINSRDLISKIIERLIDHKSEINSVNLASILKLIRYVQKDANINSVVRLLDEYSPIMDKYELQVNIHMACVCLPKIINHKNTFNKLIEQFLSAPEKARLKDMAKITEIITTFNINTNEAMKACQVINSELESEARRKEQAFYPRVLISVLSYLSFNKVFNESLASKVLDEAYISTVYDHRFKIEDKLLHLNMNMELECPGYKGNQLSSDLLIYLSKKHSSWVPETFDKPGKPKTRFDTFVKDFITALRVICDDSYWHLAHVLPHFYQPDIIVHLDDKKNYLIIPNDMKKRPLFSGLIPAPQAAGKFFAFVLLGSLYHTRDGQLIGPQNVKLRQLKLIGYTPIPVLYTDFLFSDPVERRVQLINEKINSL